MSNRQYLRQFANEFQGGFQPSVIAAGGATPTPDFTKSDAAVITMTAATTLAAPGFPSPKVADEIRVVMVQDATGGRTMAWNAAYRNAPGWVSGAASTRATAKFCFDGMSWQFIGGSTAFA